MADQPNRQQGRGGPDRERAADKDRAADEEKTGAAKVPSPGTTTTADGTTEPAAGDDITVAIGDLQPPGVSPGQTPTSPTAPSDADDATVLVGAAVAGSSSSDLEDEGTVIAAPPQGRPRLLIHGTADTEREFLLSKNEVTIGRSPDCDVVLSPRSISRLHARVTRQGSECVFTPVAGHHNTYVNDEVVTRPRLLHHGDRIQLASEQLVYYVNEEDGPAGVEPARRFPVGLAAGAVLLLVGVGALVFYTQDRQQPTDPKIESSTSTQAGTDGSTEAGAGAAAVAVDDQPQNAAAREAKAQLELQRQQAMLQERTAEQERQRAEELARQHEEHIRELLYEGDVAFVERRYTTPPEGSAVYAYAEVLKLDATNERALTQTAQIIDEYLAWAEQAQADGRFSQARLYTEKAAYVHELIPSAGDATQIAARLDALHR